MFKVPIKTNILITFLLLIGVVATSLLFSQYYFSEKLAIESTNKTFSIISNNIREHLYKESKATRNILNTKSRHADLLEPITFNPIHSSLKSLIQILEIKSNIYSIYFAQGNGAFYEVVNMQNNPLIFESFNAPSLTQWTIITVINNEQQYAFLTKDLKLLKKRVSLKKYDPRNRPWYKKAIRSKGIIITNPYLFSNLDQTGITYATELTTKGIVLAVDYTMEQLNEILALQKFDKGSEIFLVDHNGKKFASSAFSIKKHRDEIKIPADKTDINFTQKEKEYIANHTPLLLSNEDDWAPFDFATAGKPKGYSIDLINLLSLKSGLKFQFSNGYQWTEIISMFQKGDLDIVHSVYKTPQREKMGLFSKPIYSFKNYFIVSKGKKKVQSIGDIKKKRVAVVKGWSIEGFLKQHYPEISLLTVDNISDAFLAVSRGHADAMIDTKESFEYLRKQLHIDNLKLSGWVKEFDNNETQSIHMMIHKDVPILLSILNKTLDSLSQKELSGLHNKWFEGNDASTQTKMLDAGLMQAVLENRTNQIIKYDEGDKHYFAKFNTLASKDGFMGIKVDADQLLKPYRDNIRYALIIAFILLLLAIPIIILSADRIVSPIKALILENTKIKERKYSEVNSIATNIIEFEALSSSQVSMSKSIQAYERSQEELLDSIIKVIAEAIDTKSPYTGKHCARVPTIAQDLLEEANRSTADAFKTFSLTSKDELREFEIGAWLHDCGKVTTPEYVVDKSTKLETIYNRIHEIRMRFEVLWRDVQIEYLKEDISLKVLQERQARLRDDFAFIASSNIGGEFMGEAQQARIKEIAQITWQRHFDDRLGLGPIEILRYSDKDEALPVTETLLSDKAHHIVTRENFDHEAYIADGFKVDVPEHLYNYGEIYNLCIEKGTLSPEERYKINEHVIMSIKMLEKIPFPAQLTKIPEYAGTHHETLIGTGYPRKLSKEELSIPARIMAIADIFEALTASDRPYKKAKTLSESIKIMSFMVKDQHIDEDLFKLFLSSGIYKTYAKKYLTPEQIDEVDVEAYIYNKIETI